MHCKNARCYIRENNKGENMNCQDNITKILDTGIALSKEKNRNKLLDMILDSSMEIANCDGERCMFCGKINYTFM